MKPISAYRNEYTGKAYQSPLTCLRDEFDHLMQDAAKHCFHILSQRGTQGETRLSERMAEIKAKLDTAEMKGREFYALVAQLQEPKAPIASPANVVNFPIKEHAA
jgi:hypothetical protein